MSIAPEILRSDSSDTDPEIRKLENDYYGELIVAESYVEAKDGPTDALRRKFTLGISVLPGGANYAVHANEDVEVVDVCVLDPQDLATTAHRWRLEASKDISGGKIFSGFIPGLSPGAVYYEHAGGETERPRTQYYYDTKLLDPYAREIRPNRSIVLNCHGLSVISTEYHSVIPDAKFDWGDDHPPAILDKDRVIYEGHVRGATMLQPGIPENLRGTYAGFAHEAHIKHLKDLGITTVELLPIMQSMTEPSHEQNGKTNYWGYNTLGFFAPHIGYASGPNAVKEVKEMVKKLHDAGIEVVMDVVYNHTAEGDQDKRNVSFNGFDKEAYQNDGNKLVDFSGCGNTFKTSNPPGEQMPGRLSHGQQVVFDSMRHWAKEFHIDGFRFDLAPALLRDSYFGWGFNMKSALFEAIKTDPILKEKLLIAEPWDTSGYMNSSNPLGTIHRMDSHWREWSGVYRDRARTIWRENGSQRIAEVPPLVESLGLPDGSVNFVTAHDGFSLSDLVSYNKKHNEANGEGNRDGTPDNISSNFGVEGPSNDPLVNAERRKAKRNMILTLLVSLGTPMMLAGDEVGNSQAGNNNAYCQDNEIGWLDWDLSEENRQLFAFVQAAIDMRKKSRIGDSSSLSELPILNNPLGEQPSAWVDKHGHHINKEQLRDDQKIVGLYRSGSPNEGFPKEIQPGEWVGRSILVYFNLSDEVSEVVLPTDPREQGLYGKILDTSSDDVDPDAIVPNVFQIAPRSMQVLTRLSYPLPRAV